MPSSALLDILCRMEAVIIEYSEELVAQLARRDELEFEKEVKKHLHHSSDGGPEQTEGAKGAEQAQA